MFRNLVWQSEIKDSRWVWQWNFYLSHLLCWSKVWEAWEGTNWEPMLVSPLCHFPPPVTLVPQYCRGKTNTFNSKAIHPHTSQAFILQGFKLSCIQRRYWKTEPRNDNILTINYYMNKKLSSITCDDFHYSHDRHMDVKQVDEWRNRGWFSSQALVLTTQLTFKLSGYSCQEMILPSEDNHISACCRWKKRWQ